MLSLRRRAKPGANSKIKVTPSSAKISVVNTGKKAAVPLHRRAGMSPAKKQGTLAKQWPPTAAPGRAEVPPGQEREPVKEKRRVTERAAAGRELQMGSSQRDELSAGKADRRGSAEWRTGGTGWCGLRQRRPSRGAVKKIQAINMRVYRCP